MAPSELRVRPTGDKQRYVTFTGGFQVELHGHNEVVKLYDESLGATGSIAIDGTLRVLACLLDLSSPPSVS